MKVKQKSRTPPHLMNQRDKFGYSFWNSFGLRKAPFFFSLENETFISLNSVDVKAKPDLSV